MLNAKLSFALLWQRLIAALSLIMAAALTPAAVTAPAAGGAGAIGSGAGSGTTVASTANALAANVAALIEGGQRLPADTSPPDGTKAKAFVIAARQEIAPLHPAAAWPARGLRGVPRTHSARSGEARAPPLA